MVSAPDVDLSRYPSASGGEPPGVRPGRVYRYTVGDNVVRIARVIEVRPDTMGIPQVRFEVRVGRGLGWPTYYEESRTLTLEAFASQFREAIDI
jgi:hypothetical protein